MLNEFKKFAIKGNALDMAVGIIIGAAFGTIVKSLVDDLIMPPIGLLIGNVDFSQLYALLKEGTKHPGPYASLKEASSAGAVTLNYGLFINNIVSFLIVSFSVFLIIKMFQKLNRNDEKPAEPETKECPHCLSKISIKATKCAYCTAELS